MRPEPLPPLDPAEPATPEPQPFWPRFSRAITLLGIGAVAHTFLPAEAILPPSGAPPIPLTRPSEPAGEPRVVVDQLTIFAPIAPVVRPPNTRGDRRAAATPRSLAEAPVSLAQIASGGTDGPSPVGTAGIVPAASAQPPEPTDTSDALPLTRTPAPAQNTDAVQSTARLAPDTSAPAGDVAVATVALSRVERPAPRDVLGSSEAAPAAPSVARADDEDLVRRLLDEFTGAFERLDVRATKAMWPSVDDRKLRRAYGQLSAQRLSLESCGITISGRTANARCQGSATYQPKIGTRPVQIASREWMFHLSKPDAAWQIVNTVVR